MTPMHATMVSGATAINTTRMMLVVVSAIRNLGPQAVQMKIGNAGLVKALGAQLFHEYVVPFEISSVLFLSAIIGAVVISKKETSTQESH